MASYFRGGIRLPSAKDETLVSPIVTIPAPEELVIPLPDGARPCVAVGEHVLRGQRVAEAADENVVPVHAGASGRVAALAPWVHSSGRERVCVAIECDKEQQSMSFEGIPDWRNAGREVLLDAVRDAGIAGQMLLRTAKNVDFVIINAAESTPYESSVYRIVMEQGMDIADGAAVLHRILPQAELVIGIEENRTEARTRLEKLTEGMEGVRIQPLSPKYPQSSDYLLMRSIAGRELTREMSPEDLGCILIDAASAAAIGRAVRDGIPLMDSVLTAAGGAVKTPRNLRVPVGTSLKAVAAACGGFSGEPEKIIVGDSMQGIAQPSMNVPVDKDTKAVLFLEAGEEGGEEPGPCVHCGRCVDACPMYLLPCYLYDYARLGLTAECMNLNIRDCIGCGTCTAVCPSGIPLSAQIRETGETAGVQEIDDEDILRIFRRQGGFLSWTNRNDTP